LRFGIDVQWCAVLLSKRIGRYLFAIELVIAIGKVLCSVAHLRDHCEAGIWLQRFWNNDCAIGCLMVLQQCDDKA